MNILFVYSQENIVSNKSPLQSPEEINFGISYISSFLKQHGHTTRLVVLGNGRKKAGWDILRGAIDSFHPKLVAFSTVATQYSFIEYLASKIKQPFPDAFLMAGGAHPTLSPDEVIEGPFDAICIGEGEHAMLEIVTGLESGEIPWETLNCWFKRENRIIKNPTRPFRQNLDEFPFPDREIWFEWINESLDARFSILLGRGCPFECTYCSNHALRRTASGKYVRFRSPQNILDEIKYLHEHYPSKRDYFLEVETFNVNKKWVFELCRELKTYNDGLDQKLTFGTNIRITPKADFDQLFAACVKAGIRNFTVGLESGSERVRKEIMKRIYSNEDVVGMAKQAKKHGCAFTFQNMIGLPTETEDEFKETVELNRICQPNRYFLSMFYPYPGTDLARMTKEMGLLSEAPRSRKERTSSSLSLPTFPAHRLRKRYLSFEYDVYKGKKPLYKIVAVTLIRRLNSNRILGHVLAGIKRLRFVQFMKSVVKS